MITSATVAKHIAAHPKPVQVMLRQLRKTIQQAAPGVEETISYGIPTYKLNGKNVVHFCGYKNHIGFYPGSQAIVEFKKNLTKYTLSKGTIQFPLDKPLPLDLITKIVKYRVKKMK